MFNQTSLDRKRECRIFGIVRLLSEECSRVPHFYLVCIVCVEICDDVAGVHRVNIQIVVVIVIVVDIIVYIQDQGENSGRKCGKVQSLSCRKRKLLYQNVQV